MGSLLAHGRSLRPICLVPRPGTSSLTSCSGLSFRRRRDEKRQSRATRAEQGTLEEIMCPVSPQTCFCGATHLETAVSIKFVDVHSRQTRSPVEFC